MTLPRKRCRRLPRGWAEGLVFPPIEQDAKPPKRRRKNDAPIIVTDDWPDNPADIPIGDDELRIIEGYMRTELDELFGPSD